MNEHSSAISAPSRVSVERGGFRLDVEAGLTLVRSLALLQVPGIGHAFSTRRGPAGSDFDLAPGATKRSRELCAAVGLSAERLVLLRQVHGATVFEARAGDSVVAPPAADAAVAFREHGRGPSVAVRTADCVPLILAEACGRAVAAVHAGWRGVAARVVPQAVSALAQAGCAPALLRACLGPAIGGCCYQVGREVLESVARGVEVDPRRLALGGEGDPHLDLRAAVRLQLEHAGVPPWAIDVAPWCTSCSPTLFFSHRRDGAAAGRHLACIGWIEP